MVRAVYLSGFAYLAACATIVFYWFTQPAPAAEHPARAIAKPTCATSRYGDEEAKAWYCTVKSSCNRLETTLAMKRHPPPNTWDGAGYAATCFALAGQIDEARRLLSSVESEKRSVAAAILFDIGHPVADRGDDVAAGPIMDLVLEFWPENFQAVYHAGMSAYALGDNDKARQQLRQFRVMHPQDDSFGKNADRALERIARGLGPESANPGAH